MSLRARLTLAILALVAVATIAMWGVSSRGVFRPFTREVMRAFVAQAVYVAEEVESGADPDVIGDKLGCEVRVVELSELPLGPRPVDEVRERRRERLRGEGPLGLPVGFTVFEHKGRRIAVPPGPRDHVLVETSLGWLLVRREIDLDRPLRQLRLLLPAVGTLVLVVALGLAGMATRPLTTAREGMERIAKGDLAHRLDEEGPEEMARVARAFNAMADRITSLLRTERELMAGMSHEIRTPLSRLRLEVELLRDEGLADKRLVAMEADLAEVDGLVGQLLHLSRLQLGERVLSASDVDWKVVVGEVLASIDLGGHTVEVRGPGGPFRGDPDLLRRVAHNLLQNCARYAPPGTRVTVSCEGGALVVEDEGPGVPEDQLPRMFDPFWRGEASRARATGGLGLGLMLVRQVVDLHGGTVTAANRVGGGLRVAVALPVAHSLNTV